MQQLISFDLFADFGFFRKPETNEGINLSYNNIHKPAILGILGGIIGLDGYKQKGEKPEYAIKLAELKIGVQPLNTDKGNFQKTVIKYSNTVGYANKGATYLTEEATLVKPAFRVFLLLDTSNEYHLKLSEYLKNGHSEYLPYFGKNEFYAWWNTDSVKTYHFTAVESRVKQLKINTLFLKGEKRLKPEKDNDFDLFDFTDIVDYSNTYIFFERLPHKFHPDLHQYELEKFALTTMSIENNDDIENLYWLKNEKAYVQIY